MKVHYITSWGENKKKKKLQYSPAGLTKAKYVVSSLKELGYCVEVGAFTYIKRGAWQVQSCHTELSDNNIPVHYCFSFPHFSTVGCIIQQVIVCIQLFFYLLTQVNKDDVIIVYHERYFYWPVKIIKSIVKRKLVLEIEEVYTMAANSSNKIIQREINHFSIADAYILINDIIASYCKLEQEKPQVVLYGIYKNRQCLVEEFGDNKIHVVYAGTLSLYKGGAYAAASSALYLNPTAYHIHILGFGSDEEITLIKKHIEDINNKGGSVTFDGLLTGKEFDYFMSKCHIGLSTQSPTGDYNLTSFPSKVLSYISYGLSVVSVRLEVLEKSLVNNQICYCQTSNPKDISNAIRSLKTVCQRNNSELLELLNVNFKNELNQLLKKMQY